MPYITQAQLDLLKGQPTPAAAAVNAHLNVVKAQIQELQRHCPARRTEDDAFFAYTLIEDTTLFEGVYSNIYLAIIDHSPDHPLIGRVYEPVARIDARKSSFLRVLAHIGRRSPGCIATWDVFYDDAGRVVVFQEFALHGNLRDYLTTNNVYVPEDQMREWARQIYSGMDYLGDNGIVHRSITPKHILITPSADEMNKTLAKLASFRDAIIYLAIEGKGTDNSKVRVRRVLTRPREASGRWANHFHAPECFTGYAAIALGRLAASASMASMMSMASKTGVSASNLPSSSVAAIISTATGGFTLTASDPPDAPEDYCPIAADLWSFAATFFYANARTFPLGEKENALAEGEDPLPAIQRTIGEAPNLSATGKRWFGAILGADPSVRMTFEAALADPWFTSKEAISG